MVYRVAEGGPFDLVVEGEASDILIENVTDDLVNAKILIPYALPSELAAEWDRLNRFDQAILYRKWPEIAGLLAILKQEHTNDS